MFGLGNIGKAVSAIGYQAKGLTQAGANALASKQMPTGALDKLQVENALGGAAKAVGKSALGVAGGGVGAAAGWAASAVGAAAGIVPALGGADNLRLWSRHYSLRSSRRALAAGPSFLFALATMPSYCPWVMRPLSSCCLARPLAFSACSSSRWAPSRYESRTRIRWRCPSIAWRSPR